MEKRQNKIHSRTVLFVLVAYLLLMPRLAYAGAWALPQGEGQIISTTVHDTANQAYDDKWKLTRDVNFAKVDSRFFMEHGLTSKLTLVLETAIQDVDYTSRDGRTKVQGLGNSAMGARYQFFKKGKHVTAIQGTFILAGNGENISDADLGRGGNGLELRALYGRSFKALKRDGFVDLQAAWIYRSGQSPDSYKSDISLGINATKNIQLIGQAFYSKTNGQVLGIDRVLSNESLKLQASLVRKTSEKRSYQVGVFQTVAGRNIVKEKAVIFGVWQRY